MYGKIFESMYDGTLADNWEALITFQQMIVLCDSNGVIDMTPSAISRRTGIPVEHIESGIEILEKPDKNSRTPDEDGRRIRLIDDHKPWGWYIVNHNKYKVLKDSDEIKEQNRIRKRRQREKSQSVTQCHAMSQHTDTDTDTDTDIKDLPNGKSRENSRNLSPPPYRKIVDLYHEALPELPRVEKLNETRRRYIRKLWIEDLREIDHWGNYFKFISKSDFLMGRQLGRNGGKPFVANLEWLTKPANFLKVSEEIYHG